MAGPIRSLKPQLRDWTFTSRYDLYLSAPPRYIPLQISFPVNLVNWLSVIARRSHECIFAFYCVFFVFSYKCFKSVFFLVQLCVAMMWNQDPRRSRWWADGIALSAPLLTTPPWPPARSVRCPGLQWVMAFLFLELT